MKILRISQSRGKGLLNKKYKVFRSKKYLTYDELQNSSDFYFYFLKKREIAPRRSGLLPLYIGRHLPFIRSNQALP